MKLPRLFAFMAAMPILRAREAQHDATVIAVGADQRMRQGTRDQILRRWQRDARGTSLRPQGVRVAAMTEQQQAIYFADLGIEVERA